ncbi:MAG: enoyl-CoA hydratase, partial [Pseudomonadota bacterium]
LAVEVTEPDALLEPPRELAQKNPAKTPLAVRYAKRLLKLAQQQPLSEHLELCSSYQALCHKTEDHAEALAAFFEKRQGKFEGR